MVEPSRQAIHHLAELDDADDLVELGLGRVGEGVEVVPDRVVKQHRVLRGGKGVSEGVSGAGGCQMVEGVEVAQDGVVKQHRVLKGQVCVRS